MDLVHIFLKRYLLANLWRNWGGGPSEWLHC